RSDTAQITLVVESSARGAVCPFCGHFSDCRHSQYVRRLLDLPADGRKVVVHWRIRKFRCINPNCQRRVFAERIPGLARPHARRTERLDQLLTRMGVFLGSEGGARLARDFGATPAAGHLYETYMSYDAAGLVSLAVRDVTGGQAVYEGENRSPSRRKGAPVGSRRIARRCERIRACRRKGRCGRRFCGARLRAFLRSGRCQVDRRKPARGRIDLAPDALWHDGARGCASSR
ncbi:MAG: transposase family protein, partial [Firmicutes bacterium]|nr:transposase family protein [Bacillota bacterium]